MDNEFQWRKQMRELNAAVEPARDLWPAIAARIAQPTAAAPRRRLWQRPALALAASLLVAVGAGFAVYRLSRPLAAPAFAGSADPKLAAAARELDKASAELQAALEAQPQAVFLVGMLNRTNAQRMRLLRQAEIQG